MPLKLKKASSPLPAAIVISPQPEAISSLLHPNV
jgi:hypothetical protein